MAVATMVKVDKEEVVDLFVSLGFKTAAKWSADKLTEKLTKIEAVAEDADALEDKDQQKLLKKLVKAVKAGDKISFGGDEEENEEEETEEEKPVKSKGKTSKKAEPEDEDEGDEEETPKKKKAAKPEKKKGEGVIGTIIQCLQAASKKKPVSKEDILKKLIEKFPDRNPDSMRTTIGIQIPNRLKAEKGLDVHKDENGYWLE